MGSFEQFTKNEPSTVKILTVKPGEAFSLQYHLHREELWHVLSGDGEIRIGEEALPARAGDTHLIPPHTLHRITGGSAPVVVLEVSFGEFDEGDIVRIEDKYGKGVMQGNRYDVDQSALSHSHTGARRDRVAYVLILIREAYAPRRRRARHTLTRAVHNPILKPRPGYAWESEAVFNPAAVEAGGRVHLFYRALGQDGVSRIGYASSADGYTFDDRPHYPVFEPDMADVPTHVSHTSPARLRYDRSLYASGGGWGGAEDPRAVVIDGTVHLTFSMFNGWNSIRMTHTSISVDDLLAKRWRWTRPLFLSPHNSRQKNWVLFPKGIRKRFSILHGISPIRIEHVDALDELNDASKFESAPDHGGGGYRDPTRRHFWDCTVRGAGAPPIATDLGWLLFYQSLDQYDPGRYKVGAMILDRDDPAHILYRSPLPLLEPDMHYENDWKPGIVYASGAVVKDGTVFIYYGGGDKTVSLATTAALEAARMAHCDRLSPKPRRRVATC